MSSTLIIGIGTSGLNIIEEIQQFHYEFTGKNKPGNNVEYMYIETDASRKPRKTANGETDIKPLIFSLGGNAVDVENLKRMEGIDKSWLPESSAILANLAGAGGMPTYGRLSLWGASNFNNFRNELTQKYQLIGGNPQTQILIVGSLTGGTGSGLCVDIPYLVKNITGNANVNAIFLLPDFNSYGIHKELHENAYSALLALEHYSREDITYEVQWPDGSTIKDVGPPYQYAQFLSQDLANASAPLSELSELLRVAGMIGALMIFGQNPNTDFFNLISARRVDSSGNNYIKNFITAGFYMIQYPKSYLEELLSIGIASQELERLVNPENFWDINRNLKSIASERPSLINLSKNKLEEILSSQLKSLDGKKTQNGKLVPEVVEEMSGHLMKNTHGKDSKERYLFDAFSPDSDQNYYAWVNSNVLDLKENLIGSISSYLDEITSRYGNLYVNKVIIETLGSALEEIEVFYQREYGLTNNDDDWSRVLASRIEVIFNDANNYLPYGYKTSYLDDAIKQLFELAKYNSLIAVLRKIKSMLISNDRIPSRVAHLCNLLTLEEKILQIKDLINGEGSSSFMTLRRRKTELEGILDRFSSSFKMIYVKGDREQDIEAAQQKYLQSNGLKLRLKEIFSGESIWKSLNANEELAFSEIIKNSVAIIKQGEYFGGQSLKNILNNYRPISAADHAFVGLFSNQGHVIKSKVPAMVKLVPNKYAFAEDPKAKLIILSNDQKELATLFRAYPIGPVLSNSTDVFELQNAIVIYQEYGYMSSNDNKHFKPSLHLATAKDLKRQISSVLSADYKKRKIPYLTLEQVKEYLS